MDERPAPADTELTDSEQRLLAQIRAGLVDAEIAVRLGISNAEVKSRTERLAAKLRVDGRDGLRGAPQHEESAPEPPGEPPAATHRRRALMPLAVTAGLALAFVAGLLVASRTDDDPDAASADERSPATATVPITRSAQPTQPPRIEVIDGREMEWFGPLLSVPNAGFGSVVAQDSREDLLVVTLAGNGRILFGRQWRPAGGGEIFATLVGGSVGGGSFDLGIQSGDEFTRLIHGDDDSIAVVTGSTDRRPVLILWAGSGDGPRYHLRMNPNGEIFVATEQTPRGAVLDFSTGDALDVASATRFWDIEVTAGGFFFNRCAEGKCSIIVRAVRLEVAVAGEATCPRGDVLVYRTDSLVLTFEPAGPSSGCSPSSYEPGDAFVAVGHYVVTAATIGGLPLSIAADSLGAVYVGEFEATTGCPCRTGT